MATRAVGPRIEQRSGSGLAAALLGAALAGCGGGSSGPSDGGTPDASGGDADAGLTVTPPQRPNSVAPPGIAPCPTGWRVTADDDELEGCEPWPDGGRQECAANEAHLPGTDGCARIGPACPADGFPADVPADALFVEQGATGGTGSRAEPFATVSEALAAAGDGDVIAIAAGTYDEVLSIAAAVTLRGACTAETLLTSSSEADAEGVVRVQSDGVTLEALRIGHSARPGVSVSGSGRDATLRNVVIAEATTVGVYVSDGSDVAGERLVVRGTRSDSTGAMGWGLYAQQDATLTVSGGVVAENREQGVVAVHDGTTVRLEDVTLRDTQPAASDGMLGRGISGFEGAEVRVLRSAIEGNTEAAVLAFDPTTLVRVEHSVIRDTQPHPDGRFGYGLLSDFGATIEAARTLIERSNEWALQAAESATVQLTDVVVRETRSIPGGAAGYGANLIDGGKLQATRTLFSDNGEVGIFATGSGTTAELADVTIRDTRPNADDGSRGRGLSVEMGATASIAAGVIERNAQYGVYAVGERTELTLSDVVVRQTRSDPTAIDIGLGLGVVQGASATVSRSRFSENTMVGVYVARPGSVLELQDVRIEATQPARDIGGRGLIVRRGASAHATRVAVDRNHDIGVAVGDDGSSLCAEDLHVRETRAEAANGRAGRGLVVQAGASLELTGGLLERNREVQLSIFGEGTTATLSDIVVREALARACAPDCDDGPAGIGIGCYASAECGVERFVVSEAALCGVQLAFDASLDLRDGEVSGSPIGMCLQQEGYDLSRLNDGVRYRMNEINIDSVELPVPSAPAELDLSL